MTSDDDTVSTLSIAPDNLTDIGIIGGQDITHEQRRTNLGLVVRETNLPGCKSTPPGKRPDISWIWQHGHKSESREQEGRAGTALAMQSVLYEGSEPQSFEEGHYHRVLFHASQSNNQRLQAYGRRTQLQKRRHRAYRAAKEAHYHRGIWCSRCS